jgi:hypothetical protein
MLTIPQQLTEIYNNEEWWHTTRMSYSDALRYHDDRHKKGFIHVYEENGEVLGYYERYIIGDTCFLHNVYIRPEHRRGKVFKSLYRHFFDTMPEGVIKIVGTKQKIDGKLTERFIKGARYGNH